MSNAGKTVVIHYTGTFDNGEKFDSSYDHGEPLTFKCMAGNVIKGFDDGVVDMAVGEKKTIHIEPAEAYGEADPKLIQDIPVERIQNLADFPVGETVYLQGPGGQPLPVKVVKIENGTITLDMNNPMAGKALNFEIELLEVK